jgi:hypothetical protein
LAPKGESSPGQETDRAVRNHIDFSLDPEELFLDPVSDKGLSFLGQPPFLWRPRDPALIEGFSVSGHEDMRTRTERFLRHTRQHKTFRKVIEFVSLPVVMTDVSFRKSHALAGGKCVLNGASGFRLLNRYCWENELDRVDPEERLVSYFEARQQANRGARLPGWPGGFPEDLDFAIECRNTFNYFHFLTETLCQLCVLDDLPFRGRVFIHFPNAPEKTRSFTRSFVTALFPELKGRVFLERAPKDYDRVLSSYNFINSYYHLPVEEMGTVDAHAPSDEMWKGPRATRSSQGVLSMNSIDSSLVRLRARALAAIEGLDFSHLPRRFYVGRKADQSRRRDLAGEEALVGLLSAFGFAHIAFEDFTPLEQIALMARAEVMISAHGAGFTNMLFARPGALVIEIGTLQTAVHRWGDFWPLANVSGCRYVTFFADYNKDDPLTDPKFGNDGIVAPALTGYGLGHLMAFVAASLGHPPRLDRQEDVARLASQLLRTGQPNAAAALLDRHADLGLVSVDLCLSRADLHKARGEWNGELMALMAAWDADPARWQTLVQIIWCAKKVDNLKVQTWAVQLLADQFPDRCAEVVRDRAWLRALI